MSEVEVYDLLKESCEYDDRIEGHKSELTQMKAHVRWLERQVQILEEKKSKIDAVLAKESKKRHGRVSKAIKSKKKSDTATGGESGA